LRPYVEQINKAKDDAAVSVVVGNVLSDDTVFAFGELFDLDKIKALQKGSGDSKKYYDLLEIFAYGRYQDLKAKQADLPKLNEKQVTKLQLLTLVSLARDNRVIPYATILTSLSLANERQVEEILISALYKGVLQGKLDSADRVFKVESTIGRDVRTSDFDQMFKLLETWESESGTLLKKIEEKMAMATKEQAAVEHEKIEHVKNVEGLKATIKVVMESEMENGPHGGGHGHPGMRPEDYARMQGAGKAGKDKRGKHGGFL
jgi:COP9 signalosome complex subunit 7